MDQTENQKQQSLGQFMKSQFHGKFTQLILSISVFSLLFSRSYWFSLLHYFSFNFHNTLPFQLFSHNIDKNCMFLLCNGLLVFLAKFSGLISSSKYYNLRVDDDDDHSFKSFEDVPQSDQPLVLEPKAPSLYKDEAVKTSTVMEETAAAAAEIETQNFSLIEEEEEEEEEEDDGEKWGLNSLMTNGEELKNAVFVGEDEDLKGSSTENSVRQRVISTDELNKKCDEFIRKRKEELRIEARQ